ncbi:hypothetical protein [Micromonospora sp. NPDC005299]|uniref:hypothetical protein n=1 Tax=Micromonospora sp. NPDC005299 TaxID=3364231 RepID=UPI0036C4262A
MGAIMSRTDWGSASLTSALTMVEALPRGGNPRPLIAALVRQAERMSELSVLRVHWYDSAKDGVPDSQQQRIGEVPKVKLRLGRFGMDGQQKGVDLRIGLDLVPLDRRPTSGRADDRKW